MEPTPQPPVVTASSPGMFGTGIPSTISFAIGVLLFLLPFMEIKCGNNTLQQVSGFQLATGFKVSNTQDNSFMGNFKTNESETGNKKSASGSEKKDPNLYALIALSLGVLGLLLSFAKAKAAMTGAMVTGLLSAGALIGLMMDIKKQVKLEMPGKANQNDGDNLFKGLNNIGDNMAVSVDFTSWFYLAVIAFLAAAFFCYKRMTSGSKVQTTPLIS